MRRMLLAAAFVCCAVFLCACTAGRLPAAGSTAAPVREAQQAQRLFIDLLYRGVTEEERAILARVFDRIGENVQEVLEHAD